ncbi:MAG TPA: hypothetical protein VIT45_01285 [Allosphingosinicella sp.]
MNMYQINVEALPELDTKVGVHGSTTQEEVGGPLCLGVVIGVAIYIAE